MPINNINNNSNIGAIYMKINEIREKGIQSLSEVQEKTRKVKLESLSSAEEQNNVDKVQLFTKTLIESAIRRSSSFPEVREEKVAQIKTQIQQGTYRVSNSQIARAILGTLINELG